MPMGTGTNPVTFCDLLVIVPPPTRLRLTFTPYSDSVSVVPYTQSSEPLGSAASDFAAFFYHTTLYICSIRIPWNISLVGHGVENCTLR